VGVGVDQTGEDEAPGVVQDPLGRETVGQLILRTHRHKVSVPHRHGPGSEDLILLVHGDHPAGSQ
jgi:hypothetical protein